MTSHSRPVRTLCALYLAVLLAAPFAMAQKSKQRAVAHPNLQKITVSGTVTDAVTGQPLKGATVTSSTGSTTTDDSGHYTLNCLTNTEVSASRVGYVTVKKTASGPTLDFALPQSQSVTVKLTSGQTVVLDYVSTKFGYTNVFEYVSGDNLPLCKSDGEALTVTKSQLVKITGPAHPVTSSACCTRGPIMAIDVQTKDAPKTTAHIVDSCFGIVYDIVGIERSSAVAKYLHLQDVSEITFP